MTLAAPLFRHLLCCVLIFGLVRTVHAEDRVSAFDPTLVSWRAGEGLSIPDPDHGAFVAPPPLSLPAGLPTALFQPIQRVQAQLKEVGNNAVAPGRLQGGVTMRYEAIRLQAEHVDFWQRPLAVQEGGRSWPRRVYLMPGANGPEAERVHIDTRQTALPSMNVKGLLRPRRVTVERMPVATTQEAVVFYMLLEEIDQFKVQIRGARGIWQTVTGKADYLLIELHAQQLAAGLGDPQVAAIHLMAQQNERGRVATADRVQLTYWHPSRPARINSHLVSLYFDANGQHQRMASGKDTTVDFLAAGSEIPSGSVYGDDFIPAENDGE